jgi:hypothetical protein
MLPTDPGGVTFNCFNCGYRAHWRPGWHFNFQFRRLLGWMGVADSEIQRLQLEALRLRESLGDYTESEQDQPEEITFASRPLPTGSQSYRALATFGLLDENHQFDQDLVDQVEYIHSRGINMRDYDFYYSDQRDLRMNRRVIVPFFWQGQTVGYTARAIDPDIRPRYHSSYEANLVFNMDRQTPDRRFVIVCEGTFDAMSVDGVSVLGNRINETQAEIIERLARDIIVVPDFEPSGRSLIDDALEYGWQVSFPVWAETCKDINQATVTYGKLFVLRSILEARETNPLRIRLLERRYLGGKPTK